MALLEIQNLTLEFVSPGGTVQAVNEITYSVEAGEIAAIEQQHSESVERLA